MNYLKNLDKKIKEYFNNNTLLFYTQIELI